MWMQVYSSIPFPVYWLSRKAERVTQQAEWRRESADGICFHPSGGVLRLQRGVLKGNTSQGKKSFRLCRVCKVSLNYLVNICEQEQHAECWLEVKTAKVQFRTVKIISKLSNFYFSYSLSFGYKDIHNIQHQRLAYMHTKRFLTML